MVDTPERHATWPKPGSQTIKSIEFMYYSSNEGWA